MKPADGGRPPDGPVSVEQQPDSRDWRMQLLGDLNDLIWTRGRWEQRVPQSIYYLERDPALLHRTAAVEALGSFPDLEAVKTLGDLLKDRDDIGGIPGRWFRDTALLTLLRPNSLPKPAVNRVLIWEFSFWRHPFPWTWGELYDDLPILRRFGKLWVFFRAFWLWPVLILLLPTLLFALQLVGIWQPLLKVGGRFDTLAWLSSAVTFAVGFELYLVHWLVVEWFTERFGVLRLSGRITATLKIWIWTVPTLVVLIMFLLSLYIIVTNQGTDPNSWATVALRLVALLLPILLVPMFILTYDLHLTMRRLERDRYRRLRRGTAIVRVITLLTYVLLLPVLFLAVWPDTKLSEVVDPPALTVIFLVYIFLLAPLIWLAISKGSGHLWNSIKGTTLRKVPQKDDLSNPRSGGVAV